MRLRMINPRSPLHKSRALVLGALLLLATGCGDGADDREEPAAEATQPATGLRVEVDDSGWTAFVYLAGRVTSGQQVTRPEMGGLGAQPAWERWRSSKDEKIDLRRIANWFEATFWTELGATGPQKKSSVRMIFSESWRWSWDHREAVTTRIRETAADSPRLTAMLQEWISPANLPGETVLTILPSQPEFYLVGDEYFLDTGFLAATPRQRLPRELTGLMFRDREFIPGPNHRGEEGGSAVAHTFRALRNEGVAHWIEDTPQAYFINDHPSFRKALVIPEKFYEQALLALTILDKELPPMWADPQRLADAGHALMRDLNTIQADRNLGYVMSAVIVGHLGEERLREASRTVPGFLAAFQEAAALNPSPPPLLHETRGAYYRAVPALGDAAWSGLPELLAGYFPE